MSDLEPDKDQSPASFEEEDKRRVRVQIDLNRADADRIQAVRARAGTSTTEAIRRAIRLYEWYLDRKKEGYRVQVEKDGSVREVDILF